MVDGSHAAIMRFGVLVAMPQSSSVETHPVPSSSCYAQVQLGSPLPHFWFVSSTMPSLVAKCSLSVQMIESVKHGC